MYYLVIHLKREEYEEDVLLAMASAGVLEATVIPAVAARETMSGALPIFAGFRANLTGKGTYAKVIAAPVDDEDVIDKIIAELKAGGTDFVEKGIGTMVLLPVVKSAG